MDAMCIVLIKSEDLFDQRRIILISFGLAHAFQDAKFVGVLLLKYGFTEGEEDFAQDVFWKTGQRNLGLLPGGSKATTRYPTDIEAGIGL